MTYFGYKIERPLSRSTTLSPNTQKIAQAQTAQAQTPMAPGHYMATPQGRTQLIHDASPETLVSNLTDSVTIEDRELILSSPTHYLSPLTSGESINKNSRRESVLHYFANDSSISMNSEKIMEDYLTRIADGMS